MLWKHLLAIVPLLSTALGLAIPDSDDEDFTYTNVTIYNTVEGRQPSYARTEQLPNGDLLATWVSFANYSLIYKSEDNGKTWHPHGRVNPHVANRTMVHPALLYLSERTGNYPKGTIVFSVNAWESNSTNIEIYASRDGGKTFEYISLVASGGKADTTNGATPVWEPFLLAKCVCGL
jgi:hypothetical protein